MVLRTCIECVCMVLRSVLIVCVWCYVRLLSVCMVLRSVLRVCVWCYVVY
jgi:hypothetical protein